MKEMAQRQLALKLRLAATAKCVDRVDIRPEEMMITEIGRQNASALADSLVGRSTQKSDLGRASIRVA